MKTCSECGTTKPLGQFHRNKRMRDGRLNQCKDCANAAIREYNRSRVRSAEEKRRHAQLVRARRQSDKVVRERDNENSRKYKAQRVFQVAEVAARTRATELGAVIADPPPDYRSVFEDCDGRCAECGVKVRLGAFGPRDAVSGSFDHVVPLSRGGAHSIENIQILCGRGLRDSNTCHGGKSLRESSSTRFGSARDEVTS